MTTIQEFDAWLTKVEDEDIEFKSAKNSFSKDKDLPDYCAAISNEGGGKLILGVNDARKVIGTRAFSGTHNMLSHGLLQKIKIRVDVEELMHPDGRVLIFHIPGRHIGQPVKSTGKYNYPMRAGESLVEMDLMSLKKILNEVEGDFPGKIVSGLKLSDLDDEALTRYKDQWARKARRSDYLDFSNEKMLRAIGLYSDKGLNYTSLILFGKKDSIDSLIPCSEIIFEWRQSKDNTAHDFRVNWRGPFFKIYNEIWDALNARNIRIPYQEGLFQREVFAYSEKSIREALLNAVTHRDYTINHGSIVIKASPEEFVIDSPGGLPYGITLENIFHKSCWRNRSIAETLEKAGLVERSGQGLDDIFGETIKDGKGLPDLSQSDESMVRLIIPAQVKDISFILFIEKVSAERGIIFSFEELYQLEKIRENQIVSNLDYRKKFIDIGIIERIGKTSGSKYLLSHKYYSHEGKTGIHTKLIGISRQKQKELIISHLSKNSKGLLNDFKDIFPELKRMDISNLLQELKREEKVEFCGSSKKGFWKLAK